MAEQRIDFGTASANDGEAISTAFQKIDKKLFGVQGLTAGTNTSAVRAANKAAIEEAATEALTAGVKEIRLPPGTFWCDQEVKIGVGGADQKSLHLKGSGGGAVENQNTVLRFPTVTTAAVIVGNGQCMEVSDLAIVGETAPTSRAALTGVGIGFNHNTHQIDCRRVRVVGFGTCYKTGYNGDVLCDSTSFYKCSAIGHTGWHFSQTQNYINDLWGCIGNCKIGVLSDVGKAVNIRGGNFSLTDAKSAAFTIGSTSALSSFSDSFEGSSFTNWTFTTTLASHDQPMLDGAYDAFAVVLPRFGVVPLALTNYNSGTRVATLKFYVGWLTAHYQSVAFPTIDIKNDTDIQTELQAVTKLYACEMITPFYGTGINADGVHVENPGCLTRILTTESGFSGDRVSRVGKLYANYNPAHGSLASGTDAQKAVFYCQQVFPGVRVRQAGAVLEDWNISGAVASEDGVNIEVIGNVTTHRLIVRNCNIFNPNLTVPLYDAVNDANDPPSMSIGAGEWDTTPFLASSGANAVYSKPRVNAVRFRGWRPDPEATPRLTAAQLTDIEDGLGAIGTYPPLSGDIVYTALSVNTLFARSKHDGFSYGQNLSINWSYKGQTNVLNVDSFVNLFAGLRFTIDNGGGDQSYTITGIYRTLGYITVAGLLAGTKTTIYSGGTIKQPVYSIIKVAGA